MKRTSQRFFAPSMLWWRYFFFNFLKTTFLFVALSYALFIIVDIANHLKIIFDKESPISLWGAYYGIMFIRRIEVILPFSAGISATIIMVRAIHDTVLIPLMSSGLSLKRFLSPFLTGALFMTLLLLANHQWIYPRAIRMHTAIIETEFGREKPKEKEHRLGVIMLDNGERLFFNRHKEKEKLLVDLFWFISENEIYHIEELFYSTDETPPRAIGIDLFQRSDPNGIFQKTSRYPMKTLPSLHLSEYQIEIATLTAKELSLSELFFLYNAYGSSKTERATEATIALYSKLLFPLFPIFAVLFAAIFSLRFDRKQTLTLPLLSIIVTIFVSHIILQATNILARSPFAPTTIVLLLPWALFTYVAVRQLKRTLR